MYEFYESRVHFVMRGLSQLFMGLSRSVQHAAVCGMSLEEVEELLGGGMGWRRQGEAREDKGRLGQPKGL